MQIYAGASVQRALGEVTEDMNLYKGTKLGQVIEAAYEQGRKDGARAVFEKVESGITDARKEIPHRNPGKPRKK